MRYTILAFIFVLSMNADANECRLDQEASVRKTTDISAAQNFVNKILNHVRCAGQGGMLSNTHKRVAIGVARNLARKTTEKSLQEKFEIADTANYFQESKKVAFARTNDGDVYVLNETKNGRELIAFLCEKHGVDYSQLQSIELTNLGKPKRAKACRYKQFTGAIELKFKTEDKDISLPKNRRLHLIDKLGDNDLTHKVDGLCEKEYFGESSDNPCLLYFFTTEPVKKSIYQMQCEMSKKIKV